MMAVEQNRNFFQIPVGYALQCKLVHTTGKPYLICEISQDFRVCKDEQALEIICFESFQELLVYVTRLLELFYPLCDQYIFVIYIELSFMFDAFVPLNFRDLDHHVGAVRELECFLQSKTKSDPNLALARLYLPPGPAHCMMNCKVNLWKFLMSNLHESLLVEKTLQLLVLQTKVVKDVEVTVDKKIENTDIFKCASFIPELYQMVSSKLNFKHVIINSLQNHIIVQDFIDHLVNMEMKSIYSYTDNHSGVSTTKKVLKILQDCDLNFCVDVFLHFGNANPSFKVFEVKKLTYLVTKGFEFLLSVFSQYICDDETLMRELFRRKVFLDVDVASSKTEDKFSTSCKHDCDVQHKFLFTESVDDVQNAKLLAPKQSGNVKHESFRLATFRTFPDTIPANPNMLARTGFYYTEFSDNIKCFFCSNVVSAVHSSRPFDLSMHRSTCDFAKSKGGHGNVPIDQFQKQGNAGGAHVAQPAGNLFQQTPPVTGRVYQSAQPINAAPITPPMPPPPREISHVPIDKPMATVLSSHHLDFLRSLNLFREEDRLRSFSQWPSMPPRPTARLMARAGFFYLGNLDRTQCFSCGGVLRNWRGNDNPLTEHRKHFGHCRMANGQETRNVPDNSPIPRVPISVPTYRRFPISDEERRNLRTMFPCQEPVTPNMTTLARRLQTFTNWSFATASVQSIAEAGFFSLNVRDRTKCFYCNGGLQNWQQTDEPWEEHAKWYPTCEFLLQSRGPDFVHYVVARFPDLNRPILRAPGRDVPPPAHRTQVNIQRPRNLFETRSAPEIIDPRAQMQREMQMLEESMRSDIAKAIIEMGYEERIVKQVMKSRIEDNGSPYQTASELFDAVLAYNGEEDMQTEQRNTETQIKELNRSIEGPPIVQPLQESPESSSAPSSGANRTAGNRSTEAHPNPGEFPENEEELERRLEELMDERLCKVCMDNVADVVFIPCGHICCCLSCTSALRNCPICRDRIEKALRTYTT